ncbi:MAG TPA: ATP-binding protein, partial [Verrucomicrobiae bacterium]|nr:ATP-binding protein [Verrucomicrobiae bacterium]
NGIGIKPKYQQRIFGVFERLQATDVYEGTGIGLAIVRKAVEKMGGSVGVESDGVSGSRFWLELSEAPAHARPVPSSISAPSEPLKPRNTFGTQTYALSERNHPAG